MANVFFVNRRPLVFLGFLAGGLASFGFFLDTYDWAKWAYLALILLAVYTWHSEYHVRAEKINEKIRQGYTRHPVLPGSQQEAPDQAEEGPPPPPARVPSPPPVYRAPVAPVKVAPKKSIFEEFEKA